MRKNGTFYSERVQMPYYPLKPPQNKQISENSGFYGYKKRKK